MDTTIDSPLGKNVEYNQQYNPDLLYSIARATKRSEIGLTGSLPFHGDDIWTAYEISWLNSKGKPQVAIASFRVPCTSSHIFESKSIKLYLNSFNNTQFTDINTVKTTLEKDLSAATQATVQAELILAEQFNRLSVTELAGTCIDNLDITTDCYQNNPKFLTTSAKITEETLVSHLLKSNCLVTNQPDWGDVQIHYQGNTIDHAGLLKYIISFRNHNEFHEQCIERIFVDIMECCQPEKLTVYARYTRRGGIDINPFRSNFEATPENQRTARQ